MSRRSFFTYEEQQHRSTWKDTFPLSPSQYSGPHPVAYNTKKNKYDRNTNLHILLIWREYASYLFGKIWKKKPNQTKKDIFFIQKCKYASGQHTHYFFWDANRLVEAAWPYWCMQFISCRVTSPSATLPIPSSYLCYSKQYNAFEDNRTGWLNSTHRYGHIVWKKEKVYTIQHAWHEAGRATALFSAKNPERALKKFVPNFLHFNNSVILLKKKKNIQPTNQPTNKKRKCLWRVINPPSNNFKVNLDELSWMSECRTWSHQSLKSKFSHVV